MAPYSTRLKMRGSICSSPAIRMCDISRILPAASWLLSFYPRITGRLCGELRLESPVPSTSRKRVRSSRLISRCCKEALLIGRRRTTRKAREIWSMGVYFRLGSQRPKRFRAPSNAVSRAFEAGYFDESKTSRSGCRDRRSTGGCVSFIACGQRSELDHCTSGA